MNLSPIDFTTLKSRIGEKSYDNVTGQLSVLLNAYPSLLIYVIGAGSFGVVCRLGPDGRVDFLEDTLVKDYPRRLQNLVDQIQIFYRENSAGKPGAAKNAVINSTITAEGNVHIGDTYLQNVEQPPLFLTSPPQKPEVFIDGGENYLHQIKTALFQESGSCVLINGEGGIGKTTVAAQYFHTHIHSYNHVAWIPEGTSMSTGFLSIADTLNIDFTSAATSEQKMDLIIRNINSLNKQQFSLSVR